MNPYSLSIDELVRKARAIRRRIVLLNANSPAGGHTGADLSQVEILTALYFRILNCAPERLTDPERDIYVQSKGPCGWRLLLLFGRSPLFPGRVVGDLSTCRLSSARPPCKTQNARH